MWAGKAAVASRSVPCFGTSTVWYRWVQQCCFASHELQTWERRCGRLKGLLRRVHCPPMESFAVDGQTFELPLPQIAAGSRRISKSELEYFQGFFDGDGCVSMNCNTGQMTLQICQNSDSARVLLLFRKVFGGGIGRHLNQTGVHKATLRWWATGDVMQKTAGLLASIPSMKQAQLKIASLGAVALEDRSVVGDRLRHLKRKDHFPVSLGLGMSWSYFAGFFDAEGCISVRPCQESIHLTVRQANPHVLEAMLKFLHANNLCHWVLYSCPGNFSLDCSDTVCSKATLTRLLAHGLFVKAEQAELALAYTPSNHMETREAISQLSGLQGRYQRLDANGVLRSKELQRMRVKLRRTKCVGERAILQIEIDRLKEEHAIGNLEVACQTIRHDIRSLLTKGAHVVPSWK